MLLPLEYHFPSSEITSKKFDKFLASGYFRTANYLLRTRVLYYDNEILNTIHIRVVLSKHIFSKSLHKLYKKNIALYKHSIQPFIISEEKEKLYALHKKRFSGNASPNLASYLFDNFNKKNFNTYEVNIFQDNKLIAYSIFDIGTNSLASILCIFDDQYAKYSLGIYTMMLEIEYAKENGFKYYYPGYVAYEDSKFNYKLRISTHFEFFDWFSKKWLNYKKKDKKIKINNLFTEKLETAKSWLKSFDLKYEELFYPYFYMGGMYPKSDCVKGVHNLLINDFEIEGLFYIIEFHPEKMELILTGITVHKYQYEEYIDYDEIFEAKTWNRVLLYLQPQIIIKNEFELFAGYIFLQQLFKQQLPTDLDSTVQVFNP
jgi:arginine-tRNA-protein transferase